MPPAAPAGDEAIRQLPKHPLPQGQEPAEPRVSRFLRLRRLPFQEGQRVGGAKQQVTGCRAGGTEADLPKGAVLLNEPGVGPAGQGRGLGSQYPVDLAQILPVQKGAPAAPEGEAEIPLLVRLERLPQPLPQGAGGLLIAAGGLLVHHHLPLFAAGVGAGPRQTVKRLIIIRHSGQHGALLLSQSAPSAEAGGNGFFETSAHPRPGAFQAR